MSNVKFFHSAAEAAARTNVFPRLQAKTRLDIIDQQITEVVWFIKMTKRLPSLLENTKEFGRLRSILHKADKAIGFALEEVCEEYERNHAAVRINDTPLTESLNQDSDVLTEDEQLYPDYI